MLQDITLLRSETFDAYVAGAPNCLVLVFRQGCPNCQVLMAVIDRCRARWPRLALAGIDADQSPDLMQEAGVTKVPTVLVYRNGVPSARKAGVMSPSELMALVASGSAPVV